MSRGPPPEGQTNPLPSPGRQIDLFAKESFHCLALTHGRPRQSCDEEQLLNVAQVIIVIPGEKEQDQSCLRCRSLLSQGFQCCWHRFFWLTIGCNEPVRLVNKLK